MGETLRKEGWGGGWGGGGGEREVKMRKRDPNHFCTKAQSTALFPTLLVQLIQLCVAKLDSAGDNSISAHDLCS